MFHAPMSASEIGAPSRGASAAASGVTLIASATRAGTSGLGIDMLDLALAVDAPACDRIVMLIGECRDFGHRLGLPAQRHELGAPWLAIACLVPGAALQDDRPTVPAPWHAEAGKRHGQSRLLQGGLGPTLAGIRGHHHFGNPARGRIG